MDTLVRRVAEIIARYNMLPPATQVGVAVSGGADSVVLLDLLLRLAGQFELQLVVLHVNHQLRGAESDADEAFVRRLAETAGLEFRSARLRPGRGNLEQEARQGRREFFLSQGLRRVALGHTRSDQAETVVHRFLRGSGPSGLAAMRFVTPEGLVRPLLHLNREEIREWARTQGLVWREDSSNADGRFTRNRLRNELLPALARDYNPQLEAVLAGHAHLAQAEEDYWEQEVSRLFPGFAKRTRLGLMFQIDRLASVHLALQRRLLRRALAEVRLEKLRGLDFEHVEAVRALCRSAEGHDRVLIPGADALRSFDDLLLMPAGALAGDTRGYEVLLRPGAVSPLPAGQGSICLERTRPESPFCDTFKEDWQSGVEQFYLAEEALPAGTLLVRNWEPGDQLHRPGHRTAEKVKNLFQEYHVRLWNRRHWPILTCGGEIVWVRQFGAADRFLARQGAAKTVRITYQPQD